MARTATKDETTLEDINLTPTGPAIHHMVRGLGLDPDPQRGIYTFDQVNAHCQNWLDKGYKLFSASPTRVASEQGPGGIILNQVEWHILYIFVKE